MDKYLDELGETVGPTKVQELLDHFQTNHTHR
jgi:hypothetical protein